MTRTVRLASLLRWRIVAMHTALVVSTGILLATAGRFLRFEQIALENPTLFLILDIPVTVLALASEHILVASISNPAIRMSVLFAIFVLLGGLQWYLIAGLLARVTCGFQRAIPVTSMRFSMVLYVTCPTFPPCMLKRLPNG